MILVLIWFIIGYVSMLVFNIVTKKEITVGDIFVNLAGSILGPTVTIMVIIAIISKVENKTIYKAKKRKPKEVENEFFEKLDEVSQTPPVKENK